jgi:hypothetical protein
MKDAVTVTEENIVPLPFMAQRTFKVTQKIIKGNLSRDEIARIYHSVKEMQKLGEPEDSIIEALHGVLTFQFNMLEDWKRELLEKVFIRSR